jgi:hypothetical protein
MVVTLLLVSFALKQFLLQYSKIASANIQPQTNSILLPDTMNVV